MSNTGKYHYTDSELVEILEENGLDISYGKVERIRINLEEGKLTIKDILSKEQEDDLLEGLSCLTEEEYLENKDDYDTVLASIKENHPLDEGTLGRFFSRRSAKSGNMTMRGNLSVSGVGSQNKYAASGGKGGSGGSGGSATSGSVYSSVKSKKSGNSETGEAKAGNGAAGAKGGNAGNITNNNNQSHMVIAGINGSNHSKNSNTVKEEVDNKIAGIVSSFLEDGKSYTHKEIINKCMSSCLTEEEENSISGVTVFMEKVEKEIKKQEDAKAQPKASSDDSSSTDQVSMPGKSITVASDGSVAVATVNKQITLTNDGMLNISLAENKQRTSRTEYILESYLTEDCGMTTNEYQMLTEETKVESIRELAIDVLNAIEEKLQVADTSCADRSRGDIKKLVELPAIQDAITKLEALIERDENSSPLYTQYIGTIIKSILYINQYSSVFKDAYRNKKTLMILKYESLILAIVAAISYALATIVDYKANQISLKKLPNEDLMNFAPFKTLEGFNKSVDSGEFKIVAGDVAVLREFFLEVPVDQMGLVLEASDYMPLIVNGVRGVLSALDDNSGKISSYIYKAVGIIILIFSLREVIYAISKMKTKTSEMLSMISNFANLNNGGGVISKLLGFASKFRSDAEASSDLGQREIEDENRRMATKVRGIQASSVLSEPKSDEDTSTAKAGEEVSTDDLFGFDF